MSPNTKTTPCPTCSAPCNTEVLMRGGEHGWSTTDLERTRYRYAGVSNSSAQPKSTAADGKTEMFNFPGHPLMVRAVDFNHLHAYTQELESQVIVDCMSHNAQPAGAALPEPEMHPVFPGGTPWPHYPNLQIGQRVRVHTGEEGVIESLRNNTKKYQVLLRPGYGGQYGSWEVTPIAPTAQAAPALHPKTADLVQRFSAALAEKLAAAEKKYGYSDGWASPDWLDECRQHLNAHIAKGDPRDVAAYCAFLWHHGASTAAPAAGAVAGPDDDIDAVALARYKVVPSHDSMFHRFAVVAGDGKQQLYLGRETECQSMARKFAGAFLDGAFHQSKIAAAPTPAAQVDSVLEDAARYQWLRRPATNVALVLDKRTGYVPVDGQVPGVGGYYNYEYRAGDELDAAIDAARKGDTHD